MRLQTLAEKLFALSWKPLSGKKEMERILEELSEMLTKLMEEEKINQDGLAANTKFTPGYISQFKNKKCRNPKLESLVELANGFKRKVKITFEPEYNPTKQKNKNSF
ncbi:MAG: helix-turn-helix transcriptional regulator [Bacteroidetes bacterium]|nr:helix-turn-helix transcriptional regulator [Bacteroidota bacterium]